VVLSFRVILASFLEIDRAGPRILEMECEMLSGLAICIGCKLETMTG
jgi:hypothetical protein